MRADPALVVLQQLHDVARLKFGREPREAAQIDAQDRHVAQIALARLDRHGGAADAGRDSGIEEARQISRRSALADRAYEQMARPRDGDRQHDGGEQDGDQLVGLGVDQERIRGHVLDEVVRQIGRSAATAQRIEDERDPPRHGGQAGDDHETRLETQCPERDEQEHIEERRHLQIEDGRLGVFVVERVDQPHQQGDVGNHRHIEQPFGQQAAVGEDQAHDREHAVGDEDFALERVILLDHAGRHGRGLVGDGQQADQHQFGPADDDLAALLLPADRLLHALRQLFRPVAVEQPAAKLGEHQRLASHRLVDTASLGRGRWATTERPIRSASRCWVQTLENSGS